MTTAVEWLAQFAEAVGGTLPSDQEREMLLALAGEAAHQSERTAAPIACWMAAQAGIDPAQALAIARRVAGD